MKLVHCLLCLDVLVLQGLISGHFYYGRVWHLERIDFQQYPLWGECGFLEVTVFGSFLLWEGMIS